MARNGEFTLRLLSQRLAKYRYTTTVAVATIALSAINFDRWFADYASRLVVAAWVLLIVSTITGLLHLGRLRALLKFTLKDIAIADIRDRSSLKERIEIGIHRWSLFFAMACLVVARFISPGFGSV